MSGSREAQHRKSWFGRLAGPLAAAAATVVLAGCAHQPLMARTSAFAAAATVTAKSTDDGYALVEQSFRDAQLARMVAHFDDAGFDPSTIKPFLPATDRQVRSEVVDALRSYAEHLSAVSGQDSLKEVDAGAKAVGGSLEQISANTLVSAHFTATEANLAAVAIDALGRELVERRRRRDLPGILKQMEQPIDTICSLLAKDLGDPERSGLRNQLHNDYLDLLREQKNYIVDNSDKLSPAEKREAVLALPKLANDGDDADRALAATQGALLELAKTHAALAATAGQKDAPGFQLQLEQLEASAQRLTNFYSSISKHP